MKVRVLRALSASAVLVVAAAMYPAAVLAAEKGQQPSAKLAKPLHEAQELLNAKKFTEALAKIKEADAISG